MFSDAKQGDWWIVNVIVLIKIPFGSAGSWSFLYSRRILFPTLYVIQHPSLLSVPVPFGLESGLCGLADVRVYN